MAKIKNRDNTKYWQECRNWITDILFVAMLNHIATLGDYLSDSYKTKHLITKQHSDHTLRYISEKWKYVHIKTSTWFLIVALFIIAVNWKQPSHISVDEWLSKLRYIHTMKYDSTVKMNILLIDTMTWKLCCVKKKTIQKGYILHFFQFI